MKVLTSQTMILNKVKRLMMNSVLLIILVATIFIQNLPAPRNKATKSLLDQIRGNFPLPDQLDLLLQPLLSGGHGVLEDMILHDAPDTEIKH